MGTLGAIGTEPWRQRCQQRDAKGNEGGEEWGGGIPLPSRLGDMGKHQKLPQHGPGQSPGQNGISKIWMPKKPSGSTYFTKFSAIILQLLLEVWAWRAHGKKRLGMLCHICSPQTRLWLHRTTKKIHCIYLTKFVTLTLNYLLLAKPLTIAHHTEINKGTFWNKTDLFTDFLIDFSEVIIDSLSTFCVG